MWHCLSHLRKEKEKNLFSLLRAMEAVRLEDLLEQKNRERKEIVAKLHCLFCKTVLENQKRNVLFEHLWETHHFHVGHPDNLVFLDEFLESLRTRLHVEHKCLKCEKSFPDYNHVRLHMRKKQHLAITGRKEYDRFFLSNYVNNNGQQTNDEKTAADKEKHRTDDGEDEDDEEGFSNWIDDSGSGVLCLFCDVKSPSSSSLIDHMRLSHKFDILMLVKDWSLDFFARIRLINYLRREIVKNADFDWTTYKISPEDFANVQFLFPTLEDDGLLTHEFDLTTE